MIRAGWDQGEATSGNLEVSLEQLCATLSVGICRRVGEVNLC